MFNKLKFTFIILILATLVACGGGSGGGDTPAGGGDNDKNRIKTLRIATFGDSTANVSPEVHDVQVFKADLESNAPEIAIDSRKYLIPFYYPAAYIVGNGGISGDTTAKMLARDELPASATRKATEDIIALKPQVILFRGGSINDLQALIKGTTQAERVSVVNAVYTKHISLLEKFTIAKIPVLDAGIFGYLPSKVEGFDNTDPAQIYLALTALNKKFKAYASAKEHNKVTFINPVGIVSEETGKYLPKMTYDGVHLSLQGSLAIAKKEAEIITTMFGQSASAPFEKGGKNLYPEIDATKTERDAKLFDIWGDVSKRYIKTVDNKKYQFSDFKGSNPDAQGGFNIKLSPVVSALEKGKTYGISLDIIVENTSDTAAKLSTRLDFKNNKGEYRLTAFSNGESAKDTLKGIKHFQGHIELPPLLLKSVVDAGSAFIVHLSKLQKNATVSIGVTALSIVELPPAQ